MELRSAHKRLSNAEYKELKISLSGLGCYESDMEIQEMRHLMAALKASMGYEEIADNNGPSQTVEIIPKAKEDGNQFEKSRERVENELIGFQPTTEVHNSTMIIPNTMSNHPLSLDSPYCSPCELSIALQPNKNLFSSNTCLHFVSSPFNSPEKSPTVITVQAEVHHENDWNPLLVVSSSPSQLSILSSLSSPSSVSPPSWRNCHHSSSISFEKSWGVSVDVEKASQLKCGSKKNDITSSTFAAADTNTASIITFVATSGITTTTTTAANTFVVNDEIHMRSEDAPASPFSSSGFSQGTFILSSALPCGSISSSLSASAPTTTFDFSHSIPEKLNDSGISSIFSNSMKIGNYNRSNEKASFDIQSTSSIRFNDNEEKNDNNKVIINNDNDNDGVSNIYDEPSLHFQE